MRVGISLLTLVPGVSGGTETYARELVRALGRVGRNEYRVLLPTIATRCRRPAGRGRPRIPRLAHDVRAHRRDVARDRPPRSDPTAPRRPRRRPFPAQRDDPPRRAATRRVSSVLDLQHEDLPQFFSRAERAYRKRVYGWTVRRSRLVITISHHAARTLVERLGVPEERARPIHLGIDHDRFRPGPEEREPFLLYPALGWPHKNHPRLFEAFALLRRERPELELVLTGYDGAAPDGVRVLGRVPADELARLYRTAAALVFPSLYEGFGQPPLEAMACGCPVAVSNAASLPEVCGDAARLFDPSSAEAIAVAVEDVLARPDEWRRRGLERAAAFTWEATARAHDDVYAELGAR